MPTKPTIARGIFIGLMAAALLFAAATVILKQAKKSTHELPVYGQISDFRLVDSNGDEFSRSNLIGKISIVNFIFTSCQTACPIMSAKMERLYHLFKDSDKIQFVSVSVDPARDTMEVLQQYAKDHGVTDGRWKFLRGEINDVVALSENSFMLAAENLPMGHSTKFVLVDRGGQIRGFYDGLKDASINVLVTHIKTMVKKIS